MKSLIKSYKRYKYRKLSKKIIITLLKNPHCDPRNVTRHFNECIALIFPDVVETIEP